MLVVTQDVFDEICNEKCVLMVDMSQPAQEVLRQLGFDGVDFYVRAPYWCHTPSTDAATWELGEYRVRDGRDTTLVRVGSPHEVASNKTVNGIVQLLQELAGSRIEIMQDGKVVKLQDQFARIAPLKRK